MQRPWPVDALSRFSVSLLLLSPPPVLLTRSLKPEWLFRIRMWHCLYSYIRTHFTRSTYNRRLLYSHITGNFSNKILKSSPCPFKVRERRADGRSDQQTNARKLLRLRFRQSASHVRDTVLRPQRSGAVFRGAWTNPLVFGKSSQTRLWLAIISRFYAFFFSFCFSFQGFCCSCLASVNAARQPRSYVSDDGTAAQLSHNTVRVPPTPDDDRIDLKLRGEPDCTNISTSPSYANPFTYHESSHCFRYSDLWWLQLFFSFFFFNHFFLSAANKCRDLV